MANIEAEINYITIDNDQYSEPSVSVEDVKGEDYILAKIDSLEIKIDTNIAMSMFLEMATVFKFGLIDLEDPHQGKAVGHQ